MSICDGTGNQSLCFNDEIISLVSNKINLGTSNRSFLALTSILTKNPISFTYTIVSQGYTRVPGVNLGTASQIFQGHTLYIDSMNGGTITDVLCVDVFDTFKGGNISAGYCTIWSGGNVHPAPTPTPTNTVTPTITPTITPSPTVTSTPITTVTASVTPTFTPSVTMTMTMTPEVTQTVTPTPTAEVTPTVSATLTPTVTATITPSPTPEPGVSVTPTLTATITPSITASITPTFTPSATVTPTVTASVTPTQTPPVSPTMTLTPTVTASVTPTATAPVTPTPTVTATITPTITTTPTVTATTTPAVTPTSTVTPTITATITPSATVTPTVTASVTPSITPTMTVTPTITATITPTVTPTITPSPSVPLAPKFTALGTMGAVGAKLTNAYINLTTTSRTAAVGSIVVLTVVRDNAGTGGATNQITSISNGAGNTFTKVGEWTNSPSGANSGTTVAIFYTTVTSAISTGSTLQASFPNSPQSCAMSAYNFDIAAGKTIGVQLFDTSDSTTDIGSLTSTGVPLDSYLFFRGIGGEVNSNSMTVTSGWTAISGANTTGSTSITNQSVRGEFKIASSTSETSNPTTGLTVDWSTILVTFNAT